MAISKEQYGFGAVVAILSGILGIVTALITIYSQASDVIKYVRQDFAPVGTVISSTLPPVDFAKAIGEDEGAPIEQRKWLLADGRRVTGTKLAILTHDKPLPNLQNRFLRGIDLTVAAPREAGSFQLAGTHLPYGKSPFAGTAKQTIDISVPTLSLGNGDKYNAGGHDYFVAYPSTFRFKQDQTVSVTITDGGDEETRPENVAVYFYIKIN